MTEFALDPRTTALVVVDMQNDFCEEDGFYKSVGTGIEPVQAIIPPIANLLTAARKAEAMVLYTAITYQPQERGIPTDLTQLHDLLPNTFGAFRPRLITGTWGSQVIDRLAPSSTEIVVEKPGYSIFYGTQVESLLRRRGIRTLLITGAATNGCIIHSAYDAFVRDFDVVILEDAVISYWPDLHDAAMKVLGAMIGPVKKSEEIISALEAQGRAA